MSKPGKKLSAIVHTRAKLYRLIRQFFLERDVLEVIPPVLADHTVSDPHIQSFAVDMGEGAIQYLQTSPEFAMKKLLAKDPSPIYSLGPVFRRGEAGRRHRPEFTMLEWYRPGLSLAQLEAEVSDLIATLAEGFAVPFAKPQVTTFAALFDQAFACDPHGSSDTELAALLEKHLPELSKHLRDGATVSRNDLLDSLFSQGVEPKLSSAIFVREFPASQAALAKVAVRNQQLVALRSELYWQGIELANAYEELTDAAELRQRIEVDNQVRLAHGYTPVAVDEALLEAIDSMPECVGVALGVDRLLMLLIGANDIDKVSY
ncbi:MAG: EF-P lysine aminoacylase EpmA [Pseudomonadales bacterium]